MTPQARRPYRGSAMPRPGMRPAPTPPMRGTGPGGMVPAPQIPAPRPGGGMRPAPTPPMPRPGTAGGMRPAPTPPKPGGATGMRAAAVQALRGRLGTRKKTQPGRRPTA